MQLPTLSSSIRRSTMLQKKKEKVSNSWFKSQTVQQNENFSVGYFSSDFSSLQCYVSRRTIGLVTSAIDAL